MRNEQQQQKKKVVIKEKLLSFTSNCTVERVESNSGAMAYISAPC